MTAASDEPLATPGDASAWPQHLPAPTGVRAAIASYVWQPPTWPAAILLAIAVPLLVFGGAVGVVAALLTLAVTDSLFRSVFVLATSTTSGVGMLLLAIAAWRVPIALRGWSSVSDGAFDAQLSTDVQALIVRGRTASGLRDPSEAAWEAPDDLALTRDPMVLTRGVWPEDVESEKLLEHIDPDMATRRLGRDGKRRFGIYEVNVLYMAQHHMCLYTAFLYVATGTLVTQQLSEAHYKDVTSMLVDERTHRLVVLPLPWLSVRRALRPVAFLDLGARFLEAVICSVLRPRVYATHGFGVRLTSGAELKVPFQAIRQSELADSGNSLTREVVNTLRELLREKRMGFFRVVQEQGAASMGHVEAQFEENL